MVPFLYLVYAHTGTTLAAQTVVAHATSLGVAFVTSTVGTWRYARSGAIDWRSAAGYAIPGIVSAFLMARLLTRVDAAGWVRTAFGVFLLASAVDMARRARHPVTHEPPTTGRKRRGVALALIGCLGGALSALLGIGGGLIAVPALLYIGRLPVKRVAPTALAGVCLTTLAGGVGYLTAGPGPAVSEWMTGFMDLRMLLPLGAGAVASVPVGVRVHQGSSGARLYTLFAAIFTAIAVSILWTALGG